jgi:hypothetical protein
LAVRATEFLATVIASGRFRGLGIGCTADDVDRAVDIDFIEDIDVAGQSMRRDYGLLEVSFDAGPQWVVTGFVLQLHRLAADHSMANEWAERMGVEFPRYLPWDELRTELGKRTATAEMNVQKQGGFVEYRVPAAESKASVLVVNEPGEQRGYRVGHQDVWSVSLWGAARSE